MARIIKIIKPLFPIASQDFVSVFLLMPGMLKNLHKLLFVIILLLAVTSTKIFASQSEGNKLANVLLLLDVLASVISMVLRPPIQEISIVLH